MMQVYKTISIMYVCLYMSEPYHTMRRILQWKNAKFCSISLDTRGTSCTDAEKKSTTHFRDLPPADDVEILKSLHEVRICSSSESLESLESPYEEGNSALP